MMEIKYDKDMNHNYLIIKGQGEPEGDRYQIKMLTDNKIPGLLGCSTRYVNGEVYLYYEVNSLQSLATLYENKKMDKVRAIRILTGFRKMLREIQSFLLTDSGLLLRPEHIYCNYETEETFFVYYPYENGREENTLTVFMEFLVTVIDHRDDQLVDMVYGLCQLAESGHFVADELDYYLENAYFDDDRRKSSLEPPLAKAAAPLPDAEYDYYDHNAKTAKNKPPMPFGQSSEAGNQNLAPVPPLEKGQKKKFMIMVLVSLAGALAILYIRKTYILTAQELLLTWILLFTFLFVFLITGMFYLFLRFSVCSEIKPEQDGELVGRSTKYYQAKSKSLFFRGGKDDYCNHYNKAAEGESGERRREEYEERQKEGYGYSKMAAGEKYGDTVFLYSAEEKRENKLYGISRGNKYHIDLNRLPCVIGKMDDCTDYCIAEASVSRMHVKFTGKENEVFMTDLNSTNGTYKNGLRLQPSETVRVEPGDEIKLGKLIFSYR